MSSGRLFRQRVLSNFVIGFLMIAPTCWSQEQSPKREAGPIRPWAEYAVSNFALVLPRWLSLGSKDDCELSLAGGEDEKDRTNGVRWEVMSRLIRNHSLDQTPVDEQIEDVLFMGPNGRGPISGVTGRVSKVAIAGAEAAAIVSWLYWEKDTNDTPIACSCDEFVIRRDNGEAWSARTYVYCRGQSTNRMSSLCEAIRHKAVAHFMTLRFDGKRPDTNSMGIVYEEGETFLRHVFPRPVGTRGTSQP